MADCQSVASDAQTACNASADDDDNSSLADSLISACKDLQVAGAKSADNSNQNAKACQDAWGKCVQTCGSSADLYNDNDDWSTFNSLSRNCSLLQQKSKAMLDASKSSQKASAGGMNCLSTASENSSTKKDQKSAAEANAQAIACTADPSGPGCTTSPQYAAAEKGQGQFGLATPKGNVDVTDSSDITASGFTGADGGAGQNVPKVNPVANNTGGGVPGGGGGSAGGGGGSHGGGLIGAISSAITNIEKGFLGGGAPTAPAPTDETKKPEPGADGIEPADANNRSPAALKGKASLSRYLPGGDLWKGLKGPATNPELHGPDVDLWSRVHERMIERCKLKVLFDCQLPK